MREIEWQEAKTFILNYEWLGNMGTSKYCYGLLFGNQLAAVVCYGPLVAPSQYSKLFDKDISRGLLQICRGASIFWAPKWAPSKLISSSLKMLKNRLGSELILVMAYANPEAGEIGTIYQACNAYYLGETSPGGGKRYIINGHSYDPRKVYKKFGSRKKEHLLKVDKNYSKEEINPKHRYLFIRGSSKKRKEILNQVRDLIKAYPKRF
ncbi:MAG: hypothetical protein JRI72_13330 [Deltaproteobacteria bacterium]|nr:hypothetical protein [Deltaproteobacteria bacterium]